MYIQDLPFYSVPKSKVQNHSSVTIITICVHALNRGMYKNIHLPGIMLVCCQIIQIMPRSDSSSRIVQRTTFILLITAHLHNLIISTQDVVR